MAAQLSSKLGGIIGQMGKGADGTGRSLISQKFLDQSTGMFNNDPAVDMADPLSIYKEADRMRQAGNLAGAAEMMTAAASVNSNLSADRRAANSLAATLGRPGTVSPPSAPKQYQDTNFRQYFATQNPDGRGGFTVTMTPLDGDLSTPPAPGGFVPINATVAGVDATLASERENKHLLDSQAVGKAYPALTDSIIDAKKMVSALSTEGVKTGGVTAQINAVANFFGMGNGDLEKLNAKMGLYMLNLAKTLGSQPTDRDAEIIESMNPSVNNSPAANIAMLNQMLEIMERTEKRSVYIMESKPTQDSLEKYDRREARKRYKELQLELDNAAKGAGTTAPKTHVWKPGGAGVPSGVEGA